ncbi:hypothetical protein CLF_105315 [Clonorchis sinensis]|uniref:Uncharacterized protein n=1 Tax=Clonorchis sinensis TaxID=79923 RepID=G7YDD0_CLOSI|nr:hypothetical protein CLF_105315 [Clonorchis sinensis]
MHSGSINSELINVSAVEQCDWFVQLIEQPITDLIGTFVSAATVSVTGNVERKKKPWRRSRSWLADMCFLGTVNIVHFVVHFRVCKEEEKRAQVIVDELRKVIQSFGISILPTRCKVMLLDMQSLNASLTIQVEALEFVERFTYLGSCISSECIVTDEFPFCSHITCSCFELYVNRSLTLASHAWFLSRCKLWANVLFPTKRVHTGPHRDQLYVTRCVEPSMTSRF